MHAHRERSVGNLEDEGRAEAFADLAEGVFVAAEQQLRGRGRDAGLFEKLAEVDLVRAADDRLGIVDHGDVVHRGTLREAESVVVERCGGADEQRVELHQPRGFLLGDQLRVDVHFPGHFEELVEGVLVAGREFFVRVVEDGEVVACGLGRARRAPYLLVEAVERIGEIVLPALRELAQRKGLHRLDLVAGVVIHRHAQDRAGVVVEDEPRDLLQTLLAAGSEVDVQLPGFVGDAVAFDPLLAELLQVAVHADSGARFELVERLDARQHPVSPGLGQQRAIVAFGVVAVFVAQVDDQLGRPLPVTVFEVVGDGHQRIGFAVGFPVVEAVQQDEDAIHACVFSMRQM